MALQPEVLMLHRDHERLYQLLDRLSDHKDLAANLGKELDRATLLEAEDMPETVVRMNSKVRFLNQDTQKEHDLELVFPGQITGEAGQVSVLAPAGAAMIGLSVGDSIEWPLAQKKKLHLKIIAVSHPLNSGDKG